MKWSERQNMLARVAELKETVAEPLHDPDLHEGVSDTGEMLFCPGCRVHTLLNRLAVRVDESVETSVTVFLKDAKPLLDEVQTRTGRTIGKVDIERER